MAIYALGDIEPDIDPEAFVHPDATVIGDVYIGPEASVWAQTVLRGDYGRIEVHARTSVQDGTVVHAIPGFTTCIGPDAVVGHLAHLEGCVVEPFGLVGSCSVVLHRAVVRTGAVVAAQAVVSNGVEVPSGAMALGVPAKIVPDRADPKMAKYTSRSYIQNAERYRKELRRID